MSKLVKITIEIPEDILKKINDLAVEKGITQNQMIVDLIMIGLKEYEKN